MLVLSRKVGQGIRCEEAGIVVRVLGKSGSVVKLGVDAPSDVSIVRDELPVEKFVETERKKAETMSAEVKHRVNNLLNRITLTADLAESQLLRGMVDEAVETIRELHNCVEVMRDAGEPVADSEQGQSERQGHLLLVEDDRVQRDTLADLLRTQGYDVTIAVDGEDAWDAMQAHKFDLVLLDLLMPKCDGATLIRRIRANSRLKSTTVFAVSGQNPDDLGLPIGRDGADRWLAKPYTSRQLSTLLEGDLSRRN